LYASSKLSLELFKLVTLTDKIPAIKECDVAGTPSKWSECYADRCGTVFCSDPPEVSPYPLVRTESKQHH
jgi:hypothetical protein